MPVSGRYDWSQSDSEVRMTIPLLGSSPKSLDVFATSVFVKISYHPYLIQLDLREPVLEEKIKAKVRKGTLHLVLIKRTSGKWESLQIEGDKEMIEKRRLSSIEEREKREQENAEMRIKKRREEEQLTLHEQMSIEEQERSHLEELKAEEKSRAEEEVYRTFAQLESQQKASQKRTIPKLPVVLDDSESEDEGVLETKSPPIKASSLSPVSSSIFGEKDIVETVQQEEEDIEYIPGPRAAQKVAISFTPRLFPTPSRESKLAEEEDWIARNKQHLRDDLKKKLEGRDISERDPVWLKGKGDDFYRKGDFESAIEAYNSALEGDPTMASAYSNRSACHLRVGNLDKCVSDCNSALENLSVEMDPPGAAKTGLSKSKTMKLRVLARRGTAYCQLGQYDTSLADYQKACEIDPRNPLLQEDASRLAALVKCSALKDEGDTALRGGELKRAMKQYTECLKIEPGFVGCIANLAAAHLIAGEFDACVGKCTTALRLMGIVEEAEEALPRVAGPVPPKDSERYFSWCAKTFIRRGAAFVKLKKFQEGLSDYESAVELDPENEKLKEELRQVKHLANE